MATQIGITERGDAAIDTSWKDWVLAGKPAILITKDPEKLWHTLCDMVKDRPEMRAEEWPMSMPGIIEDDAFPDDLVRPNLVIHCTITGYGGSKIEPNAPTVDSSMDYYKHMVKHLGGSRVVLRIDPIIPSEYGFQIAANVLRLALYDITIPVYKPRVRISFLDVYGHVRSRFIQAGIPLPYENAIHAPLDVRLEYMMRMQGILDAAYKEYERPAPCIEVCGEPGIICNGCVSVKDMELFNRAKEEMEFDTTVAHNQRKECMCVAAKHELLGSKTRCPHACLYCYWRD